jgi:uncharacterized protein YheU (UPF0270 family)
VREGDAEAAEEHVEIAPESLSPAALRGVVEEFVTREGTDYGHTDRTLEGKVEDVMRQLDRGEAKIVYDPERESVTLVLV